MRRTLGAVFFSLIVAGPALAGPPLLTDDTGTPGDRHWEINVAYTLDKRHAEATHQTPLVDLNYGVGENIQFKYEIPWVIFHERDAGTRSGLGNSLMGVKWRFLDEKREVVSMSVYPQYEFNNPTSSADRGIVEEGTVLRLPVQVSKRWRTFWSNAEVGYGVHQHGDDEWVYGIIFGYDAREDLALLGELHGGSAKEFRKHEVVFNIGTQWDLNRRYGLLASIGRSFRSSTNDPNLLIYLGLQIRLGE